MKANELRLGNYVYAIDYNNSESGMVISRVAVIGETTLMLENLDLIHNIKDIEPIELTDHIISKCDELYNISSFDKRKVFCFDEIELTKDEESGEYFFTINIDENYVSKSPIKYLHQLQNLYFAICGKELEVKF